MSKKTTLENTPEHDPHAQVIAYRSIKDAQAIYVENTKFRGSQPLTGLFEIYDTDDSIWQNKDGIYHAEVICSWHGTDPDEESLTLTLEGYLNHVIVGLDDEVIAAVG